MDIEKFLQTYFGSIKCKKHNNGYVLSLPILYDFADEQSVFYISQDNNSNITISDMGKTLEYLNSLGIETEKYLNIIQKLCKNYDITIENNALIKILPGYETNQTIRAFYSYIGVLNFIANLNVFED